MAGNPAKPKHPSNPVGQTARIRKARRDWARHIKPIQAWLLQQFEQIPRQELASNVGRLHVNRYVYQISVERLNAIVAELVQRLGSGSTKRRWLTYIREAYTQGTGQQVVNLQNVAGEQYNRTLAEVLRSDSWLTRIAMIESRVFEQMEAFEGDTANDLARVLRVGVENGLNPREVAEDIRERFGVSQSRANRISSRMRSRKSSRKPLRLRRAMPICLSASVMKPRRLCSPVRSSVCDSFRSLPCRSMAKRPPYHSPRRRLSRNDTRQTRRLCARSESRAKPPSRCTDTATV